MDWGQVVTIIFGTAGFMGIFMLLVNKRIDTLENSLDKRLDSLERRIDRLEEDMRDIRGEIREIRELLYKVLGAPAKEK